MADTAAPAADERPSGGPPKAPKPPRPPTAPKTAEDAWASLTTFEKTAVQVSLARCGGAGLGSRGNELFDCTFDEAIVDAAMPAEEQAKCAKSFNPNSFGFGLIAGRTVAIDDKVISMLAEGDAAGGTPVRQVVILGAGLDCRAWRLNLPPGTTVFEVDSGAVEELKMRSLERFPLKCTRVFLTANVGLAGDLVAKLPAAGHNAAEPTLWVAEGLIGYLTRPQHVQLFKAMAQLSPLGSRFIMTPPATEEQRKAMDANGSKLYHVTREPAEHTLKRLEREGWSGIIRSKEDLGAQYGIKSSHQAQIYAERVAPRRRGCAIM